MKQLLQTYFKVFLLKTGVDNIPYSKVLLGILSVLLILLKTFSMFSLVELVDKIDNKLVIQISPWHALLIATIWLAILVALVWSILNYFKLTERLVQVLSAFIAFDLVISILFFFWVLLLSVTYVYLQTNSWLGIILMLSFVALLYWQFVVYLHIFANSLPVGTFMAGVYAIIYMLLQHNISEILTDLLVRITK